MEGLRANILELKAREAPYRVEIRDLKREVGAAEDLDVEMLAPRLNAVIVVWGTALDDKTFYPRLWVRNSGLTRSATPVDVTSLPALADYASLIWSRLLSVASACHLPRWTPSKQRGRPSHALQCLIEWWCS